MDKDKYYEEIGRWIIIALNENISMNYVGDSIGLNMYYKNSPIFDENNKLKLKEFSELVKEEILYLIQEKQED